MVDDVTQEDNGKRNVMWVIPKSSSDPFLCRIFACPRFCLYLFFPIVETSHSVPTHVSSIHNFGDEPAGAARSAYSSLDHQFFKWVPNHQNRGWGTTQFFTQKHFKGTMKDLNPSYSKKNGQLLCFSNLFWYFFLCACRRSYVRLLSCTTEHSCPELFIAIIV